MILFQFFSQVKQQVSVTKSSIAEEVPAPPRVAIEETREILTDKPVTKIGGGMNINGARAGRGPVEGVLYLSNRICLKYAEIRKSNIWTQL